ncbi:hypothetical protein EV138_5023 [Kribbella voronezhensis]|uniref:Uncharacterized protein n=1 Tax=Kribbella voronezhensis TaxID=2512212 RepID=A0A4R7TIR2_9ACTN|nr:hypothetical protein [Kribbella voronezhensis]TDU91417.1 hypothetical protein EV138_5023 [Kribbella voronezhensis]
MKISTPHVAGCVTVAAMMPYLSIKIAWLLGSDIGVVQPGLMRTAPFVVGNSITAAMELTGAALALALVHPWGRRLPAWMVLFPLWVAGGLLAPVMLAAPLGFLAGNTPTPAADNPIDGLQGWVYGVVYAGFILQGTGLAVTFVLHVRARWAHVLRARLGPAGSPSTIQVRLIAAVGALVALVVAARLFWAFGGSTGLTSEARNGRSVAQRALDISTASLALAGLVGLVILVSHRPRAIRAGGSLMAAGLGTGAMFCSGGYQLTLLIAPGTPFDTAGGLRFGLVIAAQVVAGLLGAIVLRGIRVPSVPQARSGSEVLLDAGQGGGCEGNGGILYRGAGVTVDQQLPGGSLRQPAARSLSRPPVVT